MVWFATAEEKKIDGRFKRVGSERVRVVFFTEDARERGGRSGDVDGIVSAGRRLRWSGGLWQSGVQQFDRRNRTPAL